MLSKLKRKYIEAQFNPGALGLFVNPFYFARKGLHQNIVSLIGRLSGDILDVGCGQKPYESYCRCDSYTGLEIDTTENRSNKKADFYYDGITMPFGNKKFDGLISNQVFEHVFNPDHYLKEMNRVTKIGGGLLITAPFVWDEHEQPYDFARYSCFGLKHLLEENGFEVVEHRKTNNGVEVIFQMLNAYIYKITISSNIYINALVMMFFIAPVNCIGLLFSKILPRNDDLYLDNILLARKTYDV